MRYKRNYVGVAILASLMAGCGGEEQSSSSEVTPPEQPVSLNLKDASLVYPPSAERHEVNLNHYVTTSNNSPFKLTRVEALSSDAACQVVGQTDTQFYVAGDTKKACDYRYFAESANGKSVVSQSLSNTSNSALVRLATTEQSSEAELPPLTNATLKNTPVSVDLKAQFDAIGLDTSNWVLSQEVTLPYNHNALVDVDVANQTLTYTPESDFTGIDRILFSFTDAEQNPRLGHVDVAVSVEGNQGLIIEEDIIYPTSVTYGETVEIDVSPYVTSPDGDDYQLVYLQSFDAEVTPTNSSDLYNKSLTFSSKKFGSNGVTFAVSDHKGSYAVGGMQIEVEGNTPWGDIFNDGMRFLAPLTTIQADIEGVDYDSGQADSDYPSLEMALMTPTQFESYCASKGADVATLSQWKALVADVDIKGDHQWPVQYGFAVNDNGTYHLAMSDGTSEPLNDAAAKPMCVQSSYLVVVHNESDLSAIADGADVAKVAVRVTFNGEYVENELVSASKSQGSSADLVSDSVMTDSQGMAVFELTNLKAEALTLTMEYGGKQAEAEVKFNGDVETAVLDLKASVNNQSYSGTNEVMASLSDAFDNPLSGYEVSFSAPGNDNVDVQSQGSTNTYGEQAATVTWVGTPPSGDTTVDITAEWSQGGTPLSDITSVTFKKNEDSTLGICGGQVDDTDPESAIGYCLKVREIIDPSDNKLKRFTSTPSIAVMDALGYHLHDSGTNAGQSYASTYKESGSSGPSGGEFARFRQDGDGTAGGTQHQRYCQNLADIGFAGRTDWQRPTKDELVSLYGESGNMWTEFGWPAYYSYWSETPSGGVHYYVRLYDGNVGSYYPSYTLYGSCVSTKQPEPTIGICGGQ
ncbi:hypothetical protein SD467_004454, partial [Vibrio parahaemolyticus]|nr:hypothetical protein [Vibrio parahaemolyticus]